MGQSVAAEDSWQAPFILCLGLTDFGIQFGTIGIVVNVVDTYRDKACEAFATMDFVKNALAFRFMFYINDWIATLRVRSTFFVIGWLTLAGSLTTIPMYIYGNRARTWLHVPS